MIKRVVFFFIIVLFLLPEVPVAQIIQTPDSCSASLATVSNPEENIRTLLILSEEFRNSDPSKALDFAKKAYEKSLKSNNTVSRLKVLNSMAQIYWTITDFKKAMNAAEKAKELAEKLHNKQYLAQSLRTIGLIYIELSDFDKSSAYFFKSLKLFETLKDKKGVLKLLSDIGSVNFHQNNFEKALDYYFRSLKLAKEIDNQNGVARAFNNIAAVYQALEEYEKADTYFLQAAEINKKSDNKLWEGINYMNLGTINFNLKNNNKALAYFQRARSIFKEIKSLILQARCELNLAKFFLNSDKPDRSFRFANMALSMGRKYGLKQIIFDAAAIIQKIYLRKGDKEKAYEYLRLQYETKDSLVKMENRTELVRLELQYRFEKREQEKKIEQQKKNRIILIIIITLLAGLILVLLFWVRQRVKVKNGLLRQQKLEYKLESKNREMTTNVMTLMKKNEMLSTISEKLMSVKTQAVKQETKEAINKIAKDIQKTVDKEIWEEFKLRFNQVHSDFYDKLLERFPNLTPNEQRLCALLKLNMTTKEISELTGQRVSSIETLRYRLRKKLGITNSQVNLVTFLSQI